MIERRQLVSYDRGGTVSRTHFGVRNGLGAVGAQGSFTEAWKPDFARGRASPSIVLIATRIGKESNP